MDKMQLMELVIKFLFIPLLGFAIKLLEAYLTRKAKVEQVESIIKQATEAAWIAVQDVGQNLVDDLKESGLFDEEAGDVAFEMALGKIKKILSKRAIELLRNTVGDVDVFLEALIESMVDKRKRLKEKGQEE